MPTQRSCYFDRRGGCIWIPTPLYCFWANRRTVRRHLQAQRLPPSLSVIFLHAFVEKDRADEMEGRRNEGTSLVRLASSTKRLNDGCRPVQGMILSRTGFSVVRSTGGFDISRVLAVEVTDVLPLPQLLFYRPRRSLPNLPQTKVATNCYYWYPGKLSFGNSISRVPDYLRR